MFDVLHLDWQVSLLSISLNGIEMYVKLSTILMTIVRQATAHSKNTNGLEGGSASYWKALRPHRKLDQVAAVVLFSSFC
jgi:hypothetical protein